MARLSPFCLHRALYVAVALLYCGGPQAPAWAQSEAQTSTPPVGTILIDFRDGGPAAGALIFDPEGNLYGTAGYGGYAGDGFVFRLKKGPTGAWKQDILYQFRGVSGGMNPIGGLTRDAAGNLYGTTVSGGNQNQRYCNAGVGEGCGLVFELSPTTSGEWHETVLYEFTGGEDGGFPQAGLVEDAAGNLYGTTQYGGDSASGVVFELTPVSGGTWKESVLHTFVGEDGLYPVANLVIDKAGNLYGTPPRGGDPYGCGVVFEVSPSSGGSWNETVLHSFSCGSDGGLPLAAVTLDALGNVFGTAFMGGTAGVCSSTQSVGCGVVFGLSLTSSGWKEKVLHSFTGGDEGGGPQASVALDAAGSVYGTTVAGGLSICSAGYAGCGVDFELRSGGGGTWEERVLHAFRNRKDGADPVTGLVFDPAGNLYGTTLTGGYTTRCNCGAAFEITP
jgi:uncharacterized repeat protein (TIGR03803 family)